VSPGEVAAHAIPRRWAKSTESPGNLRYVADLPLSLVRDLVTLPKAVIGTHSDTLLEGFNADQLRLRTAELRPDGGAISNAGGRVRRRVASCMIAERNVVAAVFVWAAPGAFF